MGTDKRTGKAIDISLPAELYDAWLVEELPRFQGQNRRSASRPVVVDFSRCEWVSPLPLLMLATEIMTRSASGREISLIFGKAGGANAETRARTRKFLALHGFLDAFATRGDLLIEFHFAQAQESPRAYGLAHLQTLKDLFEQSGAELLYGTSIVLPATTWMLPRSDDANLSAAIRAHVNKLLRRADAALFRFRTEARRLRETTLQRLNQTLLELTENAAEHAYLGQNGGYVGLYARARQMLGTSAGVWRNRELAGSDLLGHVLLNGPQHQIEVFVVDVGRGLFADAAKWTPVTQAEKAFRPLRRYSGDLFVNPMSRHDRRASDVVSLRGVSTGLMHLNSILGHHHDRTRIITGPEWAAGSHPRAPGYKFDTTSSGGYKLRDQAIEGTIFHIGISPAEIPALDPPWFVSDHAANEATRAAIIQRLAATRPPKSLATRVVDVRREDGLENVQMNVATAAAASAGTVVRVNRIVDKNLVNGMLHSWVRAISVANRRNAVLYLCDLSRYQAIDIEWIVLRAFGTELWTQPVPLGATVSLVTEDLCSIELQIRAAPGSTSMYRYRIERVAPNTRNIAGRLLYVLDSLRICDSASLWRRVHHLRGITGSLVAIPDVQWAGSSGLRVLPFYINFSVLIQDHEAARYIRRALRRMLALFPNAVDHALDQLVEAPLHDAKKWLIRPEVEQHHYVLVGSLSVSGSTLARHRPAPQAQVVGAIDCIETPYYQGSTTARFPHLSALHWDPDLPATTSNPAQFRRLGKSAFIEPIHKEEGDRPLHDEQLYRALEVDGLLKVGHWAYGDRHSLIELNSELAMEQSAASEAGAIPWLVQELRNVSQGRRVILAFPVHRLAYRLAHHIQLRASAPPPGVDRINVMLLPLSFLPRFAGGMSSLAPLTMDAAKKLSAGDPANRVTVFLDIGYITNRTYRHSIRQLARAGLNQVQSLGLLNRSTAPDPERDIADAKVGPLPAPNAYWRWHVPTMGSAIHCQLCSALPALARLRRAIEHSHPDLLRTLEQISNDWRARDVADFWQEYGTKPLSLPPKERAAAQAIMPASLPGSFPATSTTLTSLAIEQLRHRGDASTPLQLATALGQSGSEHALELLCAVVIFCGTALDPTDLHEYILQLARNASYCARQSIEGPEGRRRVRLLGLAALVFAMQGTRCKLAILTQVASMLGAHLVTNPCLRVGLIALTTDSDESTLVQAEFRSLCETLQDNETLRANYHALRPELSSARDTWNKLVQAFGRSESHSQTSVHGALVAEINASATSSKIIFHLEHLGSLLGQCNHHFIEECLRVDGRAIPEKVLQIASEVQANQPPAGELLGTIQQLLTPISSRLHHVLKRFGNRAESPLVYALFYELLRETSNINHLELDVDVLLTPSAIAATWPADIGGDYFPISGQIFRLFEEIFSNVATKGLARWPPVGEQACAGLLHPAKCWVWFDTATEPIANGVTLVVLNGVSDGVPRAAFRPKIGGLDDFGVQVHSEPLQIDGSEYYRVAVRIPSLSSILR